MSESRLVIPVGEHDHSEGAANAPLTLVEYGDYECPYCGRAYPIVKRLQKEFGSTLRFVFRNFPLSQIHEHARAAAQAAEAAAQQGRFWEMHDLLFENQQNLGNGDLLAYAKSLHLDSARFEKDFSDPAVVKHIRDDFRNGVRSGVNGTPSFYVNNVKYDESWEFESFKEWLLSSVAA